MQTANTKAAQFIAAASSLPTPVCVTAFLTPESLLYLDIYPNGCTVNKEEHRTIVSVGVYMSDKSIWYICNFTNAANALKYAFLLKNSVENRPPISKNAFALLQAEIKRTGAVSTHPQAKAQASQEAEPQQEEPKAKKAKSPKAQASLMKQYEDMKKKHPDAITLLRVGDFYETFAEDAEQAAEILGLTLTHRNNGKKGSVALAGFPHHALDTYIPKLVRAGKRVAICDQL